MTLQTAQRFIEGAMRAELRRLLEKCTLQQRILFDRAYRGGLDNLDESDLRPALDLCYRTLKTETALFGVFEPGI